MRRGHASYLLGRRSATGFWYYYPVALALKTPLALLLLVAGAAIGACRRFARLGPALGFCLAILVCALASRINIGVRHVLPVYLGLSVIGGGVAAAMLRRRAARWILAGLLLWQVASGALQHPDYLAYTNEIAGSHPENFLADSDLDWGQDMKRLGTRLQRAGDTEVTFEPFNRTYADAGRGSVSAHLAGGFRASGRGVECGQRQHLEDFRSAPMGQPCAGTGKSGAIDPALALSVSGWHGGPSVGPEALGIRPSSEQSRLAPPSLGSRVF